MADEATGQLLQRRRFNRRWRATLAPFVGQPLVILIGLFLTSRAIFYALGIRFDLSELQGGPGTDPWQLLDRHLLKTQLLSSIWHLNSQPPLFNLFAGLLLKFPVGWQMPTASLVFGALGLILVLSAYQAMVDLQVPRWISFAIAGLVMTEPASVLYQNWFSYVYPTAAILTFAAVCCTRFLRSMDWRWGFGLFISIAAVILINSTYQAIWLVLVLGLLFVAFRARWRKLLTVAVFPVFLVAGWYLNDLLQFGTLTTSSWFGMNLAEVTLTIAPPGVIHKLVRQGTLTPLANIHPFSPVASYVPRWTSVPHTGIAALDEFEKVDGTTNYNNLAYVKISQLYLQDDLAYIRAEPGDYLRTLTKGATLWLVPADEYAFVGNNERKISHYTRFYDGIVLWQVTAGQKNAALRAYLVGQGPEPSQIPYGTVLVWFLALVGSPIIAIRLRKTDRSVATSLLFIWLTSLYAYLTTSLIQFGENERFRFEVGALPVIAASVVVVSVVRAVRGSRSEGESGRLGEPRLGG